MLCNKQLQNLEAFNKNHYSYTHMSLQVAWGSVALGWEALLQPASLLVSALGCGGLHMHLILLGLVTTQGLFFS